MERQSLPCLVAELVGGPWVWLVLVAGVEVGALPGEELPHKDAAGPADDHHHVQEAQRGEPHVVG